MMTPTDRAAGDLRPSDCAFTLIEPLTTVTIIAVLVTVAVFAFTSIATWAHQTSDRQTLTILNDALNRYKCEGGSLTALTSGAPIDDVTALMCSPINWGGMTHYVMQSGVTYHGRSIDSIGNGVSYHFSRFNTYQDGETGGSSPTGADNSSYPYGQGVGYESNGGNASGYSVILQATSSGGWYAIKDARGNITYDNGSGHGTDIGPSASITFWSCAGNRNPTPSGTITQWIDDGGHDNDFGSNLTAVDLRGLTGLTDAECENNAITSLNVSGLTSLQTLDCDTNQLTSLNVSGLTSLTSLICYGNNLGNINITGHRPSTFVYTPQNAGHTPTVTGP